LLKKYHKTDDKDEAKFARAFYQSRVDGQEDHFDRALDRGVLKEDMDAFLSENEYLEMQGMDSKKVEKAVENILSRKTQRPEVNIIREAFRGLDNPDIYDFLEYTRKHEISDKNAVIKLESLVRNGTISDTGEINISDIDDILKEVFNDSTKEKSSAQLKNKNGGTSSKYDIIQAAVNKHNEGSIEKVLEYAKKRGVDRQDAIINLEKLVLSGQINPKFNLQEITKMRNSIIESEISENNSKKEKSKSAGSKQQSQETETNPTTNLSQREIMEMGIRDQDNPTEDDIIDYATERGISNKKAKRFLKKMQHKGEVTKKNDGSLRLM